MFSELIFPYYCIGCGLELRLNFLCETCKKTLFEHVNILCPVCSKRLPDGKICESCRTNLHFSRFISAIPYKHPIGQAAIHTMKYLFVKNLAEPLGSCLASAIRITAPDYAKQNPLIVPLPLADERIRWRGFNQSALIAKSIANALNLKITDDKILIRTKNTRPQLGLSRAERLENIKNVFAVKNPFPIQNKTVLLIDDVSTTCSTLKEAAIVLRQCGAKSVWVAVVAQE